MNRVTAVSSSFYGTIADNLRLARAQATDAELETAVRIAHIDEFIHSLPQGFNTLIGERGLNLSGGQAQRLAIARAVLKDAPFIILDEATSHVDAVSEAAIQAALGRLTADKTVLVIAHRLSTVRDADRILVMDEATSNLDTETEREIQAAIHTLMRGRTVLVIAHRLSTGCRRMRFWFWETAVFRCLRVAGSKCSPFRANELTHV